MPYAIPAGASDHRLGGLGFARWAYEVAEQEEELGIFFDTIIVCSVTGSTHAGMIAGFAGQERPRRVLGIDASAKIDRDPRPGRKDRTQHRRTHRPAESLRDDEITVLEGWAGDYYGIPVDSTIDAIKLTGRLEGVILDPVYEGKSMAGLVDLVTSATSTRIPESSTRTSAVSRPSTHTVESSDGHECLSDNLVDESTYRDPSEIGIGPGADDPPRPRSLVLPGEQMVGAFERDEATGMPCGPEDLARIRDTDGVVGR